MHNWKTMKREIRICVEGERVVYLLPAIFTRVRFLVLDGMLEADFHDRPVSVTLRINVTQYFYPSFYLC